MKRSESARQPIDWIDVNATANIFGGVLLIVLSLLLIGYLLLT